MTTYGEGRKRALRLYKIQGCLLGLLGVGLLICGIVAVAKHPDSYGKLPYFLGGFTAGTMTLLTAAMCYCISKGGAGADSEAKQNEVSCAMTGLVFVSFFTYGACFVGCFCAGMGGIKPPLHDDDEGKDGPNKTLAIIILVGCIVAFLLSIPSCCIMITHSRYFGGGRVSVDASGEETSVLSIDHAQSFQTAPQSNSNQISQLEAQNLLLQQQFELQKQLFQQQQQQQQQHQQQTQYTSGFYPQTPPPPYEFCDSAPSGPPPNYYDVK